MSSSKKMNVFAGAAAVALTTEGPLLEAGQAFRLLEPAEKNNAKEKNVVDDSAFDSSVFDSSDSLGLFDFSAGEDQSTTASTEDPEEFGAFLNSLEKPAEVVSEEKRAAFLSAFFHDQEHDDLHDDDSSLKEHEADRRGDPAWRASVEELAKNGLSGADNKNQVVEHFVKELIRDEEHQAEEHLGNAFGELKEAHQCHKRAREMDRCLKKIQKCSGYFVRPTTCVCDKCETRILREGFCCPKGEKCDYDVCMECVQTCSKKTEEPPRCEHCAKKLVGADYSRRFRSDHERDADDKVERPTCVCNTCLCEVKTGGWTCHKPRRHCVSGQQECDFDLCEGCYCKEEATANQGLKGGARKAEVCCEHCRGPLRKAKFESFPSRFRQPTSGEASLRFDSIIEPMVEDGEAAARGRSAVREKTSAFVTKGQRPVCNCDKCHMEIQDTCGYTCAQKEGEGQDACLRYDCDFDVCKNCHDKEDGCKTCGCGQPLTECNFEKKEKVSVERPVCVCNDCRERICGERKFCESKSGDDALAHLGYTCPSCEKGETFRDASVIDRKKFFKDNCDYDLCADCYKERADHLEEVCGKSTLPRCGRADCKKELVCAEFAQSQGGWRWLSDTTEKGDGSEGEAETSMRFRNLLKKIKKSSSDAISRAIRKFRESSTESISTGLSDDFTFFAGNDDEEKNREKSFSADALTLDDQRLPQVPEAKKSAPVMMAQ